MLAKPGNRHEHEHSVASAADVVWGEAAPQRQHSLVLGDGGDGLHGATVGLDASHWVGFLCVTIE